MDTSTTMAVMVAPRSIADRPDSLACQRQRAEQEDADFQERRNISSRRIFVVLLLPGRLLGDFG